MGVRAESSFDKNGHFTGITVSIPNKGRLAKSDIQYRINDIKFAAKRVIYWIARSKALKLFQRKSNLVTPWHDPNYPNIVTIPLFSCLKKDQNTRNFVLEDFHLSVLARELGLETNTTTIDRHYSRTEASHVLIRFPMGWNVMQEEKAIEQFKEIIKKIDEYNKREKLSEVKGKADAVQANSSTMTVTAAATPVVTAKPAETASTATTTNTAASAAILHAQQMNMDIKYSNDNPTGLPKSSPALKLDVPSSTTTKHNLL